MGSLAVWVLSAATLAGQETQPTVQRVRGVIDQDQRWSGTVLITDDLTIQDATVTVTAGTVVEFAVKTPRHFPTLTVGTAEQAGGDLRVEGTAEQPVVFRTRPDTNSGRLVVNVRSRIVPRAPAAKDGQGAPPQQIPNDAAWQHVRFEGLGGEASRPRGSQRPPAQEPAVTFHAVGAPHALAIFGCTFAGCGRLTVRAADGASVSIVGNHFADPRDRVAVEIFGRKGDRPVAQLSIARNTAAAAIRVQGASSRIMENVLVGRDAAIVIEDDDAERTRLAGNYVHNTTPDDDGRYCLSCGNPAALIENNILRGGTACVWNGSRRMSGNVLIGAGRLSSKFVKNARTHQLMQALPAGAVFERNLLLGPAYSMVVAQPAASAREDDSTAGILIRHNVFDGLGDTNRAVHLGTAGRPGLPVTVERNVFLRLPTLVYDESRGQALLVRADANAVAPPAERAFEQARVHGVAPGQPGWSSEDVSAASLAELRLAGDPPAAAPDLDEDLLAGRVSVEQARRRLMSIYAPRPDSPLRSPAPTDPAASNRPAVRIGLPD